MNEKYVPLYRKYRPQRLEEIVGQEHIKKALTNAIELNKISHAYLFTGPRGTGKTSTARIFAKSLNCKEGPTISPCGVCENCIDITNSTPMDVIEIDAASNRKVEDAQNILEKVMYAPVNSRYKIYIIDEVHMLSSTAFNALLKTLEEPPKNVIFILATTEVHKVLDTIKSRCQRFDFKRITTEDIVKHLRYIADNEKINITDDALFTIAKNSAGGMRDSIALLDQLSVLDGADAITTDDINNLLGRLSFDVLAALADKIISSQPQNAIEDLENIYNSGNEPVQILTNLMDYLKNVLVVKNCRPEIAFELTQANDVQLKTLNEQAAKLETHQIVFLIEKCADYIKELKLTNNPRLWLEVSIIDLANLAENTKLIELQDRLTRLEGGNIQTAQIQYNAPQISKPEHSELSKQMPVEHAKPDIVKEAYSNPQPQTIKSMPEVKDAVPEKTEKVVEEFSPMPKSKHSATSDLASLWGQLLENVHSVPARTLLKQWATPLVISPESVILTMKNEVLLKQFVEGNKRQMLQSAVDNMFSQKDSKIVVRLPMAGDEKIVQENVYVSETPVKDNVSEKKTVKTPEKSDFSLEPETAPEPEPDDDEVAELKQEAEKDEDVVKNSSLNRALSNMHSDNVNMVLDIFEGKVIE